VGVRCPRDEVLTQELVERTPSGEVLIDLCPECAGVWLDGGELARLAGERNMEIQLAARRGSASEVACPRCAAEMTQKEFLGILVEVCILCSGIWLDQAELEQLQIAYQDHLDEVRDLGLGTRPSAGSAIAWAVDRGRREETKAS
jgi:Zn-finger nucleic acid-binding protein